MSSPVRVRLLGPVRASVGGESVALRGKTARTVLARLSLSAGSVVGVDQLADALWDDDPPIEPSVSLRSIISRLRTQLGREAIVTDGAGYQLDTGVVDVDLVEIEAVLHNVDIAAVDPAELAIALKLWSGDALTDVAWTPSFEPERVRIQELRSRLTDLYHEAMLRDHRGEEILANLERDAGAVPLRESTQLLLMRALGACGRTADALRSGDDYRRRLIDQTGLNPSPDYDEAVRLLLAANDDPDRSPPVGEIEEAVRSTTRRAWVPPDTPFVGRDDELVSLAILAAERRVVTIIGPGGVGKTRLVTEYVSQHSDEWDENVAMVALAALDRSGSVETAVAAALGLEASSVDALQSITDRLSDRASVLILDNCEHVLSSTRMLVGQLLRDVADLHIVCTSRRRLGLPDEAIFDVGPLDLPVHNATDSAPVRLFLDRVERCAPKLKVSDPEVIVAADICRLVDGLPLALELAAARVSMFGFDGLRQRLIDGLAVPGSHIADGDRRQATIESTVDWSLALLEPQARKLFDDLSIFPSWFTLPALETVSANPDAVEAFSEILDSSLLVVDHQRPTYRLLEPVRQVARRQLDDERRESITRRYVDWALSIVDAIDTHWIGDERGAAQQLISDHRADLRWSLGHFIEQGDSELHGRFAHVLARALVDRADVELIDLCGVEVGPSLEAEVARCMFAWHRGDVEISASLAAEIGHRIDSDHRLWGYYQLARTPIYLYLSDLESLTEAASLAAADERGYPAMRSEAIALWSLGLLYAGRQTEAAALLEDHEHVLQQSGSGGFVAYTRAEVISATDPTRAIEHLEVSSREATAAKASFTQRLTDVSQLVLLVAAGHTVDAVELTLGLLPQLMRAGTYPQAWTAMRHVADLLGQLNTPEIGLLVLDSASAAASAPAVVGDAIAAEERLRTRLETQRSRTATQPGPVLLLAPLWETVETLLRLETGGGSTKPERGIDVDSRQLKGYQQSSGRHSADQNPDG